MHYRAVLLIALIFVARVHSRESSLENECASLPTIVETFPVGMDIGNFPDPSLNNSMTIDEGWVDMINSAQVSIEVAAMYVTLLGGKDYPPESGGAIGLAVFDALVSAVKRGVNVSFVVGRPALSNDEDDVAILRSVGVTVYELWWEKVFQRGILHTKFMLVDRRLVYVGSANFDWRSLSQVKEIGMIMWNCPTMAEEVGKIYDMYVGVSFSGINAVKELSSSLDTIYNQSNPFVTFLEDAKVHAKMFVASGPPMINTPHRTNDANALLDVVSSATKYIYGSVMDYSPRTLYGKDPFLWTDIDNALRLAALKGIQVRLLASLWEHTAIKKLVPYLQSLDVLPNIEIRMIEVPPVTPVVPFTRVNHAKYLVTDNAYYIGTSNWSPDYWLNTAGISITFRSQEALDWKRMQAIFEYDWVSNYTKKLTDLFPYPTS